ncbi:MAG: hypothetical protein J7621_08510 [Niastella sp.]|nr:hypothetical protein [Niastella sp.]
MIYLIIIGLVFLGLCYLLSYIFFRGEQDESKRFIKGVIMGVIIAVLAIGGGIYWYFHEQEIKRAIRECEGAHNVNKEDFIGKWETSNGFYTFLANDSVLVKYHGANEQHGTWSNEGSMIYIKTPTPDTVREISLRVCYYKSKTFYFRDIATNESYTATKIMR